MVSLAQNTSRRGGLVLLAPVILALVLAACGESDHNKIPLATIGDDTITLGQFERKVNSMNPSSLPVDINTDSGKRDFLDAMINKRVMERKGKELGYGEEESTQKTLKLIEENMALRLMKSDLVKDSHEITEDEMKAYYKNFCRILLISYMVFDTEEDAQKARNLVTGGERWSDVASRLDAGDPGPSGDWTASLRYGTVPDDVEKTAFALKSHELSQPIENAAGYFLIRLEGEAQDQKAPPVRTDEGQDSPERAHSGSESQIDRIFEGSLRQTQFQVERRRVENSLRFTSQGQTAPSRSPQGGVDGPESPALATWARSS